MGIRGCFGAQGEDPAATRGRLGVVRDALKVGDVFKLRLPMLAVLGVVLITAVDPQEARSAMVINGDFETGDFTGWSIETDGKTGTATDFIVIASSSQVARIEADYYATAGDVASTPQNTVFIANTLYQPLDLSAQTGEQLLLTLEWTFGGEDGAASAGDVLLIGLTDSTGEMFAADGQPGYVRIPTRTYETRSHLAVLNPAVFNNAPGWSLEIQLLVGVDPATKQHNGLGSYVEVDNVVVTVPEPDAVAGLGFGSVLLLGLQRRRKRRSSHSNPVLLAGARRSSPRPGAAALRCALPLFLLLTLMQATSARAWTDVSGDAALLKNAKALDRTAGILFSYAQVTNQSGGPLQDLRLVIVQPSAPIANQDGWTVAAEPYFDLPALADGESVSARIEFPLVRAHVDYQLRLESLLPPGQALLVTTAPSLTMDPVGLTPLAGVVTAVNNIPARATLTASSPSDSFVVEFHDYTTDHALPLLGLLVDNSYSVDVTFTDADDNSVGSAPLAAVTGPLPLEVPDVSVLINVPAQKEPGYTWLDRAGGYAFVFNQDAEIVWYSTLSLSGTRKLPNGNLHWLPGEVMERDLLLNVVSSTAMQLPALPEAVLHHELYPTIHGTYLSLDREYVMVDNYPTSTTDPNAPTATKQLRDEPIVEFFTDGTPLKRWPLVDIIDPTRVFWGSENTEPIDWAHTNAIVHDPRDDSVIVSVRHQSCVIKVDRVTGRLKWILGNPSNWTPQFEAMRLQPVGPIDWQYYQHAPMIAPNGNLVLFDNGNFRNSPFDPWPLVDEWNNSSGAVEFAIDEENMEVTQVWEWTADFADRIFSRFISDADALPLTGNVLIDFGGITYVGGILTADLGYGTNIVRLIEVTHDTPGQVVMDIQISDAVDPVTAYRAEHWSSMYPPNATRTDL